MHKLLFLFVCSVVLGFGDNSAQIRSNVQPDLSNQNILNAEDLVVVTHMPKEIMRSYGQHTKAINNAYCSR